MKCRTCGAEISEGSECCSCCGAAVSSVAGDTKLYGAPGTSGDTRAIGAMGVTRIYQEKDMGKTVVYKPREKKKPIFGWLVVTEGPDAWEEFRLDDEDGQNFLGTGEGCTLRLQDEKVERMHASVRLKGGTLTVTDLDTVSGTFVNDEAVTRVELRDGDTVRAGDTVLRFRKC
ncbi:MAG: FHA domain-containing protein [Geobacteraceae bacterium]|nr:FHA domain-containing protein [Geobacteraceae bacterium]